MQFEPKHDPIKYLNAVGLFYSTVHAAFVMAINQNMQHTFTAEVRHRGGQLRRHLAKSRRDGL
jgi:hypothetical protein